MAENGVNPNTMQRALYELEREGILVSERNTGRYVTDDVMVLTAMKEKQAQKAFDEFTAQMAALGYDEEAMTEYFFSKIKAFIKKYEKNLCFLSYEQRWDCCELDEEKRLSVRARTSHRFAFCTKSLVKLLKCGFLVNVL